MTKEQADNLARAFFNAVYWAAIPQATNYRIGAIEGLSKALQEAFSEPEPVRTEGELAQQS